MQKVDYLKDFRDPKRIKALAKLIQKEVRRPVNVMEVCGGHTHTIMKYGLNQILPPEIQFVHGPGCPVCIMPKERIDHAVALVQDEKNIVATLGDMIRVPGSKSSLQKERAKGKKVRMLYAPFDILKISKENPDKNVIYFAIGFETTTPMTAALIERVLQEKIKNIYFHINHVLVPPPIKAIMDSGEAKIDAFIGPAHVSVITGAKIYQEIVDLYRTPVVIAGFEPVDIMESVLWIVRQFNDGRVQVENQYRRAVTWEGNIKAQEMIYRYMEPRETFRWRGIGDIPYSALKLKDKYSFLDAEKVFGDILPDQPIDDHKLCICGDILKGIAKPYDCRVFGKSCTPQNPLGSCMVSSEGACSAYYRYGKLQLK
ncbi:MAG TPA: hydrogenase formation protein HypD [Persephonella sp.]|uniref:Hydrogenase expression/formation protein HypD n=1 Tax=Persephonella marina (strain DSM 14350 / EX-H1) TaxID=123214 RepID=C0QQ53_PERMH|nr:MULTISPECIES: hydrogenase formation protein HypD [Persephonella]ACO04922.1 hydrogenase expression/formation protein HypD [Persephonella marina EX-H1]HCB69586.1 hydrogenase formation protein HypD [Persephonella sp.]